MNIEKILLLSKGSVLDSSNNVLVSGHRLRMYKEIDELITSSSAVEGLGRAWRRARWRATGARGGGARARAVEAARGRRGRRCHGRRTDGGARKKRAAVFDEEEDERIDLRQALEVIYQRELLPVPATNRE